MEILGLMELNKDGAVNGDYFHFSGPDYKGGYPFPRYGDETYAQYRDRVEVDFVSHGFSISDLTWECYEYYCKGSGSYDGVNPDTIIGE